MIQWAKVEKNLDAQINQWGKNEETQINRLPRNISQYLKSLVIYFKDIHAITIIYFQGFQEIHDQGPLAKSVNAEVVNWVRRVSRLRSANLTQGIVSVTLCSALEEFIKKAWMIRNLPGDPNGAEKAPKDIRPSAKQGCEKWFKALNNQFSVSIDNDVKAALCDMIEFRNNYVHDMGKSIKKDVSSGIGKCWGLALLLLSRKIALSLLD